MSHVSEIKVKMRDVDAIREAGNVLGFEMLKKPTYAWYQRFVGDTVPPPGRDPKDYGKNAEYVLRAKNWQSGDYEVGIVKALDGDGFSVMYDSWGPGRKIQDAIGRNAENLKHEYAVSVATKKAKATLGRKGWTVSREALSGGRTRLLLRKR